jgi:predicted  nucleic acid-binding Zn-ribbon protein
VELRNLREELQQLRAEQKEMAQSIHQLVQTFRALATHLGIAVEPYVRKGSDPSSDRDLPGFA